MHHSSLHIYHLPVCHQFTFLTYPITHNFHNILYEECWRRWWFPHHYDSMHLQTRHALKTNECDMHVYGWCRKTINNVDVRLGYSHFVRLPLIILISVKHHNIYPLLTFYFGALCCEFFVLGLFCSLQLSWFSLDSYDFLLQFGVYPRPRYRLSFFDLFDAFPAEILYCFIFHHLSLLLLLSHFFFRFDCHSQPSL